MVAPEPTPVEACAAPSDLVELGVVRGAYGVKGWVRVAPHDPQAIVLRSVRRWWLKQGEQRQALSLTGVRQHSDLLLAKWAGCETPEAAEALKGACIEVSRAEFPPLGDGEFYWVDLIGAQVINRGGQVLGTVQGLRSNGAQDLLEVGGAVGSTASLLIPMVEQYVDAVDLAQHRVQVDWELDW